MARTQGFDRAVVVRAARGVFWRLGYDAASVPELEEATGLRRSSLYNTFGSKRGLFDAAVQSYLDEVVRPRLHPLQQDAVAPDALAGYLDGLHDAFQAAGSPSGTDGCLLISAAGAPIGHDAEVARVITDYRTELRTALGRGVDAARPDLPAAERTRLADVVTALVVAAYAVARVAPAESAGNLRTARALIHDTRPPAA